MIESDVHINLEQWYHVEMIRDGQLGKLKLDGQLVGSGESPGNATAPEALGNFYIGGYHQPPGFHQLTDELFSGCIENIDIGTDSLDLSSPVEEVNVINGCSVEIQNKVSFLEGRPGFVQTHTRQMNGLLEFSFMFRTSAPNGLLFYMTSIEVNFYYVSVSMLNGSLYLYTYQNNQIVTQKEQGSNEKLIFNDNKWHTVSVRISNTAKKIYFALDDINSFQVTPDQIPDLTQKYSFYLGGVPDGMTLMHGVTASSSSFVGCIRDVIILNQFIDFTNALTVTGASLGECGAEPPQPPTTTTTETTTTTTERPDIRTIFPTPEPKPAFGQCLLPITPAQDPDINMDSGFRFGK